MKVIDFSSGPPSAASIKSAGYGGVMLYISDPREPWMTAKSPSREYLDTLDEHGIKFGFVFQYRAGGNIDAGDAGRGYDGGYADASAAMRKLNDLRCSGHPVYMAVDWNVTLDEWNSRVRSYFDGAVAKLGRERIGIYASSRAVHWAMEDGVVAEVEPGRVLGWVAGPRSWGSWDGDNKRGRDYAVMFQHPTNIPGPDGVKIDENEVFHESWGHGAIKDRRRNTPHTNFQLAPVEYPCDMTIDTPDSGWRDPKEVQAGVIHTTENQRTTPPENVAKWQTNPANGSSYNLLVGSDVTGAKTVRSNPDNRRSWSAGEPGNTDAIHLSNLAYAASTRAEWLANPKQLLRNSEWCADLNLRYGLPLVKVSPADLKAGQRGFCGHGDWYHGKGGPAYRSDPGDGFPWDVVLAQAQDLIDQGEDMSFTDADREKLNRIHHELTHEFQTLYKDENGVQSTWRGTLMGFILQLDRKVEDIHANMLTAIWSKLTSPLRKNTEDK